MISAPARPRRRCANGVRVEEGGGVIPGADVLAADVPVEVEVAAQLHPGFARGRVAVLRGREERLERGLEVGLLGDAALDRSDLIAALDPVADLPGDRRVPAACLSATACASPELSRRSRAYSPIVCSMRSRSPPPSVCTSALSTSDSSSSRTALARVRADGLDVAEGEPSREDGHPAEQSLLRLG